MNAIDKAYYLTAVRILKELDPTPTDIVEAIISLAQAKRGAELTVAVLRGVDFKTALSDWNKANPGAEDVLGPAW
jgi:hypothetical protein